jgi:hypothetical protein
MRIFAFSTDYMKALVYIKGARCGRGRGACLALLKHCLGEGRGVKEFDDGKTRVSAVDAYNMVGQPDTTRPGEIRDNLLRLNHDTKSKELAKHIVLSVEDTTDPDARKLAVRVLRRMAFEFLKRYYTQNKKCLGRIHSGQFPRRPLPSS